MLSTLQILKLGLVAKTLLVAISLHALSALMLANFRLTTFFKASHGSLVLVRVDQLVIACLLYTSPSPRDQRGSRMPSSA